MILPCGILQVTSLMTSFVLYLNVTCSNSISQFSISLSFPCITDVLKRVRILSVTTLRFSNVVNCERIARIGPYIRVTIKKNISNGSSSISPLTNNIVPTKMTIPIPACKIMLALDINTPQIISTFTAIFFIDNNALLRAEK